VRKESNGRKAVTSRTSPSFLLVSIYSILTQISTCFASRTWYLNLAQLSHWFLLMRI
jgi:hypothetical protein